MKTLIVVLFTLFTGFYSYAQITLQDDFEGNGTIDNWAGDACDLDEPHANPYINADNPSANVLKYADRGGQYANVGFNAPGPFDFTTGHTFSLLIYIPSDSLQGNQNNQISLKLQNSKIAAPWSNQSEIIKNVTLDQWQTVTFDFLNDNFINLDPSSPDPTTRSDFDRVILQVNGENNFDGVVAYIDDFVYDGNIPSPPPAPEFDQLVWADEFDADGPVDGDKWFHQTKLPAGGSWYNGEVQHYTDRTDNAFVQDGKLIIRAQKENFTDQGVTKNYTSARLNSKFAFTHGRVEVRAKLPSGVGTWPAIWTLGQNISEDGAYWETMGYGTTGWPACGEIDIMEHWGSNQNFVQSATHTPSSHGATINHGGQVLPTASTEFHVYSLEWTEDQLVFAVDDVIHFTYDPSVKDMATWPYIDHQYILLNIAIEPTIDPSFTSTDMEIDYVRVYQESSLSVIEQSMGIQLQSYPNPFLDHLSVRIDDYSIDSVQVKIYSLTGAVVDERTVTLDSGLLTINNLDALRPNVYIIEIISQKQTYRLKVEKR